MSRPQRHDPEQHCDRENNDRSQFEPDLPTHRLVSQGFVRNQAEYESVRHKHRRDPQLLILQLIRPRTLNTLELFIGPVQPLHIVRDIHAFVHSKTPVEARVAGSMNCSLPA